MENSPKSVNIICRGSIAEGWGHVMRGITIRDFLDFHGVACTLILQLDDALSKAVDQFIEPPYLLSADITTYPQADLCFIDQYTYNAKQMADYQGLAPKLVVFDELAKIDFADQFRVTDTIVRAQLLDHGVTAPTTDCQLLEGLAYFVIKRRYPDDHAADKGGDSAQKPYDLLIVLGGGAGHEESYHTIAQALATLDPEQRLKVVFVLGANAPADLPSTLLGTLPNARVEGYVADLVSVMRDCRVAIVSGGYSKYEAAYIGLPVVALAVQDHQRGIANIYCKSGGGIYAGDGREPKAASAAAAQAIRILQTPSLANQLAESAQKLIDGRGLDRIYQASIAL